MTVGLALLAGFLAGRVDSYLSARATVKEFTRAVSQPLKDSGSQAAKGQTGAGPATGNDSDAEARDASQSARAPAALAVLRIPGIRLEVPVLEGTDALTLNRGVGWIAGTARPGERGNTGLAGHRDSFFRGLKDLKAGDAIDLDERQGSLAYVVDRIRIVAPEDVWVLEAGQVPELTLVTCYPFHYVGNAPKRYIVTARLAENQQSLPASVAASSEPSAEQGSSR